MPKTITPAGVDFSGVAKTIVPVDLQDEIQSSFLPYAYAVIGGRALPDAEDGLKPVQRRILYSMLESGYTPEKNHVKSARIVGNVMGSYHPHGDSAIYDAMVRMAQDYTLVVPLVDGHGNFGSGPGDTAAASRYTEARLSKEALALLAEVRENCVDTRPNYDSTLTEPVLLPAQFPNLLINGVSGIAVGFATKMPTHNPSEVIAAARAQLADPDIGLDELISHLPGPDLPTGAQIIGIDGIREAYETGRGTFKVRSRYQIEPVGRGRHRLIFTELPYEVQIEKVIEAIKKAMSEGRLLGIEDVKDLSDRISGTRFVVETKAGINAEALATELFTRTDLEINFNVNNTVLVAGQPRVLGLKALLQVFLDHRTATVTRRTQHRLDRATARLHLVSGLLKALGDIDQVIALVRAADNAAAARTVLIEAMGVDEVQADHILALQLRRLTRLDALELGAEADRLRTEIESLRTILADPQVLRATIDAEMEQVAGVLARPRRSEIVGVSLDEHLAAVKEAKKAATVQIADEPTTVAVLASGALLRGEAAGKIDPVIAQLQTTTRSRIVAVTSQGRALRIDALHVAEGAKSTPAQTGIGLQERERIIALAPGEPGTGHGLALATASGVVKITQPAWPVRSDEFMVIALEDGDHVVAGAWLASPAADLVLVSTDTSLLRFEAAKVRPQGLSGGGVAGIKLAEGARVLAFAAVPHEQSDRSVVLTWTAGTIKASPYRLYPVKGRATGGVRAMKLLKGAEALAGAWVGPAPVAVTTEGARYTLPGLDARRDGSGQRCQALPALVGM